MIVERGIAPKERLRQQDLYAERMQTGEKALVLKQTMTVIKIITAKSHCLDVDLNGLLTRRNF